MTDRAPIVFRDFIYMNVPTLYSIYSQVFEGVTDKIVEESFKEAISKSIEGVPLLKESVEKEAGESSRRVETRVLHDHMYNKLEAHLSNSMLSFPTDNIEFDLGELISRRTIIKASGSAEFEDFEKLKEYMLRFNDLGHVLTYASRVNDEEHKKKIFNLVRELETAEGQQKKNLLTQWKRLISTVNEAATLGLLQDPHFLENFALFADVVIPQGYAITIAPNKDDYLIFRALLDRTQLRLAPQMLSSLYGGQSEAEWTLVGFVTHVQGAFNKRNKRQLAADPNNPMMLDAYRNMFREARFFERMFLESDTGREIVVSPLAIYREYRF